MALKSLVVWSLSVVVGATAFGLAWLTTTVAVPLWGILVLTFVPTIDLVSAVREVLGQANDQNTDSQSDS